MTGRIKNKNTSFRIGLAGYIKCGYKNDKGYPVSTDYFIAKGKTDKDIITVKRFQDVYGEKPQNITIMFPSDNIEEICNERYSIYTSKSNDGIGGKLFAEGDGETFKVWNEQKQIREEFTIEKYPDIMKMCEQKSGGKWTEVLTLRFIIPHVPVFGVWELNTRGVESSIIQIRDTFDYILQNRGTVENMMFELYIKKVTSNKPGSRNSYPVIGLQPIVQKAEEMQVLTGLNQIEYIPPEG